MIGKVFKRKALLDPETESRLWEGYRWLFRNFGGYTDFKTSPLVLPTDDFFPHQGLSGHDLALALFDDVKHLAGFADWPCHLEPQEEDPDLVVAPTVVLQGYEPSPAGTFSLKSGDDRPVITYSPRDVDDPESLIATLVHELGHYFIATVEEPPPGGWDNLEYAVDLAVVYMGFGVFALNSCFKFKQFSGIDAQGWSVKSRGYLSELELLYALALFMELKGIAAREVTPYIKPFLKSGFKRIRRELRGKGSELDALRGIEGGSA